MGNNLCRGWSVMTDVSVKTVEPVTVGYLVMRGAYSQTPEGYGRLYGWLGSQGLQPFGMPSAVYLTMPDEASEAEQLWELWAPVAGEPPERPAGEDGLGIKRVGERTVAFAVHKGPYEEVGPAYEAMMAWIPANGYRVDGPPEEVYFSDPNEVPPEEYLTEVRFPVASL